jgi:hypothetical protein
MLAVLVKMFGELLLYNTKTRRRLPASRRYRGTKTHSRRDIAPFPGRRWRSFQIYHDLTIRYEQTTRKELS